MKQYLFGNLKPTNDIIQSNVLSISRLYNELTKEYQISKINNMELADTLSRSIIEELKLTTLSTQKMIADALKYLNNQFSFRRIFGGTIDASGTISPAPGMTFSSTKI